MQVVAIEIPDQENERLRSEAAKLGITPEELAKTAVIDLLNRKEDFAKAASHVLAKNAELYKRLS